MDTSRRPATTALITTALTAAAVGCLVLAGCAAPATRADTRTATPVTAPATVTAAPATATPATAAPVTAAPTETPVVKAPVAAPDPTPVTAPVTATASAQPVSAVTVPHFGSPEAAMRYLVAAYNAHDIVSERHVTGPDARASLEGERKWVNTFRFDHCDSAGGSQYWCVFDMVSKVAATTTTTVAGGDNFGNDLQSMGEITVLVAPAARPGWYMAGNLGCGG
jgi:hypothetical protein